MCGIVGFTGTQNAAPVLLDGLSKLEYRGYDSAGIAVVQGNQIAISKVTGRIQNLREKTDDGRLVPGTTGIGHTRWATHGAPNDINAHPHASNDGKFAVVHNGIIENYMELREELLRKGYRFESETDTEVIVHLIEMYYAGDFRKAVMKASSRLVGSYALGIVCTDAPDTVLAVREASPLILGVGIGENFFASDVTALVAHTRNVIYLEDGELAELTPDSIQVYDCSGHPITKKASRITWDIQAAEKGGYDHFMLKEIYEQPRAVRDTISGAVKNGYVLFDNLALDDDDIDAIDNVYIIGCGTSYHAGLVARDLIERWARIPTTVEVASEFRYRNPIVSSSTLVIAVSQSGETADTLAAVRIARSKGARVFAITNCVGSRITRESDGTLYVKANMEISVAATKSFLAQISCLALIAMFLGQKKGRLTTRQVKSLYYELRETPAQIEDILQDTSVIEEAAKEVAKAHSVMYVGRGIGSPICKEGALKLKEISYLHAEAYPAGELKHGPIALLDENVPVVAVVTESPTRMQTLSNVQEILARGSRVVAVASEGDQEVADIADYVFYIPRIADWCTAITASVPLQLFARYIALERGCDVDKPRNLAKSVTVE